MTYSLNITKDSKTGSATAYLLEDGSQVARCSRGPNYYDPYSGREGFFCDQITFKWFSERARDRFSNYCDSLSMEETVEALGFPFPFKKRS